MSFRDDNAAMAEGIPAGLAAARLLRTNWVVSEDSPGVTGPKMRGIVLGSQ